MGRAVCRKSRGREATRKRGRKRTAVAENDINRRTPFASVRASAAARRCSDCLCTSAAALRRRGSSLRRIVRAAASRNRARPLIVVRVAGPHQVHSEAQEEVLHVIQQSLAELHVTVRLRSAADRAQQDCCGGWGLRSAREKGWRCNRSFPFLWSAPCRCTLNRCKKCGVPPPRAMASRCNQQRSNVKRTGQAKHGAQAGPINHREESGRNAVQRMRRRVARIAR